MAETAAAALRGGSWLTGWYGAGISALTGVAIALGQAPISAFWLSFGALCAAIYLGVSAVSARAAMRRGLIIGLGFGVVTFSWIVEPFLVDIARHGWLAPFALLFMAAGIGLFWGLAFWTARSIASDRTLGLAVALPALWTGAEMLRSYALGGFPWGLTSYIWIDTPLYQWAAFVGPHGVTLVTLLVASGLSMALVTGRYAPGAIFFGVGASLWAGGLYLQGRPFETDDTARPVVRLIQPNAPQDQKWVPEFMPVFFERQLSLTAEVSGTTVDLVVWPEVAVPFLLNDPNAPFGDISDAAGSVPVVFGAQRLDGASAFNSMAVLGAGGAIEQVYDKHHLVPFGEYLPGAAVLNRIGLKALSAQYGTGYSAGPGVQLLDLGALGTVLPLICYEAIFPHELRRASVRPDWMLMLTNDAWFGAAAGPLQHLAQARARAIELALPMVRAANTGVSAVIDGRGRIVGSIPLGVSGRLDVALPPSLPPSLYWRFGDSLAGLALIVLVLLGWRAKHRILFDRARSPL